MGLCHLIFFIIKGTPPCGHFQLVSQTLFLTLNQFSSNPRSPRWFYFLLQIWKLRYPMGRGEQGESIKTTFIFWIFFLSPRRAFFMEQCKYGCEAVLVNWYLLPERIFGQDNDMVGCNIQQSRYPHSQNIFIINLWVVAGISLRPVRHILPINPYLDNFWSSPRLGLISLNHSCGKSINSSSGFLLDVINLSIELILDELWMWL